MKILTTEESAKKLEDDYKAAICHLDCSDHCSPCPECSKAMNELAFYREFYLRIKRGVV